MATEKTVHGISVDDKTRCEHYHSLLDIIAIKFKCCGKYYAFIATNPLRAMHHRCGVQRKEMQLL